MDGVFTFFKSIGNVLLFFLMCLVGLVVLGLLFGVVKGFFIKLTSNIGVKISEKDVGENQKKLSKLITELYGYEVNGVPEIDEDVERKVLDDLMDDKELKNMLVNNVVKPNDDIVFKFLYEKLITKVKVEKTIEGKVKYSVDNVDDYY